MFSILELIALYIVITTLLAITTKGREIRIKGKRISFTIGGVLLFLGKESKPKKVKPLNKVLSYSMMLTAIIGIVLFYIVFLPMLLKFISNFLLFSIGARETAPRPPIVPAPLLFQYQSIILYVLVAIGIGIIVHELAHALVALREGIPLKSWGIGLVFLFPIAFVEVDEDSYRNASYKTKAKIVSAGIFANAVVTLIALAALIGLNYMLTVLNAQSVVMITGISCDVCDYNYGYSCPAEIYGLKPGDLIISINGTRLHSIQDLANIIRNATVNSTLILHVCEPQSTCRDINMVLSSYRVRDNKTIPCIGIHIADTLAIIRGNTIYRSFIIDMIQQISIYMQYILIVNFSLYVLNSIPLLITDGTKLIEALGERIRLIERLSKTRIFDILNLIVIGTAIIFATYVLLSG